MLQSNVFLLGTLPNFQRTGIPFEYCSNKNEIINAIPNKKQCRNIFVYRGDDDQQKDEIVTSRYIDKIYVFGDCKKLNIKHNDVTIINTNERRLTLDIMCTVIGYIHDKEIQLRKSKDHRLANEYANDILQLLDRMKTLHFND